MTNRHATEPTTQQILEDIAEWLTQRAASLTLAAGREGPLSSARDSLVAQASAVEADLQYVLGIQATLPEEATH